MIDPVPANARRFEGKTALVTGAGSGIGEAIARRLAAEGAAVAVVDVNGEAATRVAAGITADGGRATAEVVDVSDGAACAALVERVLARGAGLDVLANNAGINRRGPLLAITPDDWDATFAVNLDAMFHLCRAALPHMIEAGRGAIVNTASQWGITPAPGSIAYSTSKAAVVAFTRCLARDYAPQGVRVNAVCPGEILTPMVEAGLARSGRSADELHALVPYGRMGRPEEVAALVAFLASDEAPYQTGAIVEITGAQAVA